MSGGVVTSESGQNGQETVSFDAERSTNAWGRLARAVVMTTHRPVRGSSRSWLEEDIVVDRSDVR